MIIVKTIVFDLTGDQFDSFNLNNLWLIPILIFKMIIKLLNY